MAGCGPAAAQPAPPGGGAAPVPAPQADGRLPPGIRPTRYALELTVDPSQKTFLGRARIGVTIDAPGRVIVMHGRGLTVHGARIRSRHGEAIGEAAPRMAAGSKHEPEELVLTFHRAFAAGVAEIQIDYQAPFASGLRGLYRVDDGGAAYAFTQFEPNDARRAFPCFDEPGYKTPFDLTVVVPEGSQALANTAEIARRPHDGRGTPGRVAFQFARTAPLPTYLVALAVGPFDRLDVPPGPAPVRLVATRGKTRGKAAIGGLAVDTAAAHLPLLGNYFGRPYPYPKLDLVAVPNFGAGAMENPGLITFREELVLLDPDRASAAARRAMASIVAHELAHQWFGNLVTMKWWDDLWLNEAFANWMSDKIVDQWKPATEARRDALAAKWRVMNEDSLATARKIRNPVRSTSEAQEAFDPVTYSKGRAVLTMTEAWLGEDAFRSGIRRYLERHQWGNAEAADLYAALAEASGGRDVAGVMNSFTAESGFPLVDARLDCRGGRPPVVRLSQREYRTRERQGASDKLWRLPICVLYGYRRGGAPERRCTVLEEREGRLELGPPAAGAAPGAGTAAARAAVRCPELLYANADEAGYYRIRLEPGDLPRLGGGAGIRLPERERFGLVGNAWAGVQSGALRAPAFLELLRSFRDEPSRLVWTQIVDALQAVDRALVPAEARPAFARYVRDLLGPTAQRLGWAPPPDETEDTKLLRELILGALGELGEDEWVLREAARIADASLAAPLTANADIARVAVPLAAKRGDATLFDRLLAALRSPPSPEIRVLALSGLAGFDDRALVERALALALDGTIKAQDLRYLFPAMGLRRAARDVTQAWIEAHIDELGRLFPAFLIGRFVRVTAALCDDGRVGTAEAALRPHLAKVEGVDKDLRQSVELGHRCAALAAAERAGTAAWLGGRSLAARRR